MGKELVVEIYDLTKSFPTEEKFGMVSQMRRAAGPICSNLAEGSGRNTGKDQPHFYRVAYSSLMELLNQLLIAEALTWIKPAEVVVLRSSIEAVSVKINSLRKSIVE